jgi:hypothetical protein
MPASPGPTATPGNIASRSHDQYNPQAWFAKVKGSWFGLSKRQKERWLGGVVVGAAVLFMLLFFLAIVVKITKGGSGGGGGSVGTGGVGLVITAGYLPHKPSARARYYVYMFTEPGETTTSIVSDSLHVFEKDGVVCIAQRKIGNLENGDTQWSYPPSQTREERHRVKDGFVEIGKDIEPLMEKESFAAVESRISWTFLRLHCRGADEESE